MCDCPDQSIPVCGEDGLTYDNRCLALCAEVAIAAPGPCPEPECQVDADCGADQGNCGFVCLNQRCSPVCGSRCDAETPCAMGQDCINGRCQGAPMCPDPIENPAVRYVGRDQASCEQAFECEEGEELFNNDCGCGCIGQGGGDPNCNCPEEVDPVCGVNDVEYRNSCEAECAGVRWNAEPCNAPCPPVQCAIECPNGFVRDAQGCEICECADDMGPNLCAGFHYETCFEDADCDRPGDACMAIAGCVFSNCDCDPDTGNIGVCTNDCIEGAGRCFPE